MAVLEEKFTVYEELSKEMLAKLESAVDKISEANQNVAKILVRHEAQLDKTMESDTAIIKILDDMKKQNIDSVKEIQEVLRDHEKRLNGLDSVEKIQKVLEDHEKRLDGLSRLRWITTGVVLAIGFILGEGRPFTKLLHNQDPINPPTPPAAEEVLSPP